MAPGVRGWGGKSSSPRGGASGPRELSGFPTGSASPLPPFQPCFGSSPASFALPPRRTFARFPLAQPSASTEAAQSSAGRNKWAGRAALAQLGPSSREASGAGSPATASLVLSAVPPSFSSQRFGFALSSPSLLRKKKERKKETL